MEALDIHTADGRRQTIEEIARRLVAYFHPERIYLFGSTARGDDGPDSDLDFWRGAAGRRAAEPLPARG